MFELVYEPAEPSMRHIVVLAMTAAEALILAVLACAAQEVKK